MHQMILGTDPKFFGAAVLLIVVAALAGVSWYGMRHGKRPKIAAVVGGYGILVMIMFIAGMLPSFLSAWACYFIGYLTAPWSMMVLMLPDRVIRLVASGWLGNFVFYVVVCGGANSILLYTIMSRSQNQRSSSDRRNPLHGPQG